MDHTQPPNTLEPQPAVEPEPVSVICGFWRRLFAFLLDSVILGLFGLIIGMAFFDVLAELGGAGRMLGFAVVLLYFGILNSSIWGGQTIGKRILKIKVVDHQMKTISLPRSVTRYTILGLPYFLNGALLPPTLVSNAALALLLGWIVFFGSFAIVYLYVFNRRTRQSLHDLIVGTYVVDIPGEIGFRIRPIWKGHLAVLGMACLAVVIGLTMVVPKLGQKEFFKELHTVQKHIQQTGLVHGTEVMAGKSVGTHSGSGERSDWEATYLKVAAILKKEPPEYDRVINQIATVIIGAYPSILEKDTLIINVTYGYDIGIANAWRSHRRQHSPEEWLQRLSLTSRNI